ncbi:28S ribosomal protein S23, mitochondrial [Lamellibrachia satsuma]|nr:28S ribosomal protein S23, mitochondrial [Lamellibrachia satsuma]
MVLYVADHVQHTQLPTVLDECTRALEDGDNDFAKAFDTVPHCRLLTKLKKCGICGDILLWTEAFLIGRRQRVDKSTEGVRFLDDNRGVTMAGSRAEKVGSIFTRVQGLLRAGALKEIDKPIWYNVYAAFPPMEEPKYERRISIQDPVNILYKEDFIRAQFYKAYGTPDVVDMTDNNTSSVCKRFVEKYWQVEGTGGHEEQDTFEMTAAALREEGVALRTLHEMKQEMEAQKKLRVARAREQQEQRQRGRLNMSVKDVFGDAVTSEQMEEADFVDEDVLDPSKK